MARDFDFYLLDHVFQPFADSLAGTLSCFSLARISLFAAVIMQTVVLAWNVNVLDPSGALVIGLGTLAEYVAAQSVRTQIGRMERQNRPGTMNVARITYRPFRILWVMFAVVTMAMGLHSQFRMADLCNIVVGLLWILTVYFMCCIASPPRQRAARSFSGAMAFGGA